MLCCARVARVDFEVARPFPATADPERALAAAVAFAAEEAAKQQQQQQKEAEAGGGPSSSDALAPAAASSSVLRPPLGSAPWRPSTVDESFGAKDGGPSSSPALESATSSSISVVLSGVAPGTPRAAAAAPVGS